jgi:hypothetical protein
MASRPYNAREITIRLERELTDDFGETAFAILRNLIFGSPVGNPTLWQFPDSAPDGYVGGHFRRNWLVSIGGFNPSEIEGVDPAGAASLASGRAQIDTYTARGKAGASLVIQNNVPYANRIAQGHSTQAEAGWVNRQIDAALGTPGGRRDLG